MRTGSTAFIIPPRYRQRQSWKAWRAGEQQYSDGAVRNPVVITLRDKVSTTIDPSIQADQARITVTLTGRDANWRNSSSMRSAACRIR